MRIRDTAVVLTNPGRNFVLVKLETADGLVGWGDASLNGREKSVEAALEHHILPDLQGRDGAGIEDIWQHFFRGTYWRGGPVLNSALAGVDMALWDLKGKAAGMPVYELLGGPTREYAAVYTHCGATSVENILENCRREQDRGITHHRVNRHASPDERNEFTNVDAYLDLQVVVDAVHEIRSELPDAELLVDIHSRADPVEAADIARQLESAGIFFLEDPIRPENPDALNLIRQHATTPLAMGELYTNPWEMAPLIERELIDFVRVDLAHVGGITAAKKLAALAEHHYTRTAFHGPPDLSPVGLAATVHVDYSIPNFGIQEYFDHKALYGAPISAVFDGGVKFETEVGGLILSDEPGLGITVDESEARSFEYDRDHLPTPRNPDGSVQDW
jgi:mannonate dehydratase